MPFATDQEVQEIRSRADILQIVGEKVTLKKSGRNHKGCCPFHQEKTPSFMVNPEKQIFHCFGCGVGGDVFSFLMKYEGLEFPQVIEQLADRYGVALTQKGQNSENIAKNKSEKEILYKINQLTARYYYELLTASPEGQRGLDYLKKRDIRSEMIKESLLGFAPAAGKSLYHYLREKRAPLDMVEKLGLIRKGQQGDYYDFFRDRVMCSIISAEGKVLGFSGRALSDEVQPKYLNSPESPIYHKSGSVLGIQVARLAIREADQVILVEGNFDLIRLHQEGLRNVVAPLGTALTDQQIRYLSRMSENFVLLFDGDQAGQKASVRALELFLPLGLFPKVAVLPPGEDPDTFVKKEGVKTLREKISNAPTLLDYWIEEILSERLASGGKTGQGPQTQAKAIKRVGELLQLLPGEIEKNLYIQRVAQRYGVPGSYFSGEKRTSPQRDSNFSVRKAEDVKKVLPPIEKMVLELLIHRPSLAESFKEIETKDFSHNGLGQIWELLKTADVSKILMMPVEVELKNLLTELSVSGSRWAEMPESEEAKTAEDCVKQFRSARLKNDLKSLSVEIRRAEMSQDLSKMSQLLKDKSILIKQMN